MRSVTRVIQVCGVVESIISRRLATDKGGEGVQ